MNTSYVFLLVYVYTFIHTHTHIYMLQTNIEIEETSEMHEHIAKCQKRLRAMSYFSFYTVKPGCDQLYLEN